MEPLPLAVPRAPRGRLFGLLIALALVVRAFLIVAPIFAGFVLATALTAGFVEDDRLRVALGIAGSLVVPAFLRWRLAALLEGRTRLRPPPMAWFAAIVNVIAVAAVALGFADDVGRALRRHGDWFVGERNGAVARGVRATVASAAGWLEKFDPPPELAPIVLPPDLAEVPAGPWRENERPPDAQPITVAWFHPLAGPRRALPGNESRRFGAARPQPRPPECELGHCGVDLGGTIGEPVFAAFDGVVEKVERDAERGGRAGRYLKIAHKDRTVVTRYIHLDSIRADLKEGDRVRGGELVARLGASGVFHSGPHLHFGVSLRPSGPSGSERYIDPEPLLREWRLPDPASALSDARASR